MTMVIGIWIYRISIGKLPYLDIWTRSYVELLNETSVFYILRGITELGSKTFLIPFTIIASLFLLILFKKITPALMLGFGTLGTHFINNIIKAIIKRDRPSIWVEANAEGYSFPSGHSMITVVCYGLFVYYLHKKIHNVLLKKVMNLTVCLLLLLIGLSRYVINVHYITDILTGFILGSGCLLSLIKLDQHLERHKH